METIIKLLPVLLLAACTSSHRVVALYESGDAVSKPLRLESGYVTEGAASPTSAPIVTPDETEDAEETSVLDSFRDMLP